MSYASLLSLLMQAGTFQVSPGLLAKMSGIPKATIVNWMSGRVASPRHWQDIIRVADSLRLCRDSTDSLVQAAGYGTVVEVHSAATEADRELFSVWSSEIHQ